MASAVAIPGRSALGWFALLPLFAAIRFGGIATATMAGAVWGTALWAFSTLGPNPVISYSLVSAALIPLIPAVYTGLATWLTRRVGFNPIVLGCGWMLAELALTPLCLGHGLLGEAFRSAEILHWVGRALGSVLVAFIIASASASLVLAMSELRLRIPTPALCGHSQGPVRHSPPFTRAVFPPIIYQHDQPRAPPPH